MNTNNGMALWRDAFNPTAEFRREFGPLFDDWRAPAARDLGTAPHFVPACEVEERDDFYLVTLDLAGVRKEDIKIEAVNDHIVISGERRNEARKKESGLAYSERRFGRFQRSFALPAGVGMGKIEAHYQDGILRVMILKAENAKPRRIEIASGKGESPFFGKPAEQMAS